MCAILRNWLGRLQETPMTTLETGPSGMAQSLVIAWHYGRWALRNWKLVMAS